MIIGRVERTITATVKHPDFIGHKILLVRPVDKQGQHVGEHIIALDTVQAGVGDLVLVMREGTGVRQILNTKKAPIRSLIVGIIDQLDIED
jgi:microcompartment protein CcmK/EutM